MKSVMISIQPKWCELIASGKKIIEVRKTRPKLEPPFKVYIYCSKQKVNGEILLTHNKKVEGRNRGFRDTGDIPLAGNVIGEFICDGITWANGLNFVVKEDAEATLKGTCLTKEEIYNYLGVKSGMSRCDKKTEFYCWHISNLVIYDKPKKLSEFGLIRPPQSWCYVKELTK